MEVMVFPFGHSLLYPSFSKPFHIRDEKYIQMVEDAVRTGAGVAVASVFETDKAHEFRFGEPLQFVHQIVGYGTPLIVERCLDGTLVIFLEGKGKAKLGRVVNRGTPYIVCEAEPVHENHEISAMMMPTFLATHKVMVHWMSSHIADIRSRDQFLSYVKTPEQVIGCFASYLVADPDLQQLILESNDINEKIAIIRRLIDSGELVA